MKSINQVSQCCGVEIVETGLPNHVMCDKCGQEQFSVSQEANPDMTNTLSTKSLHYIVEPDGDNWFAHYNTFINLQESEEVAFGTTPQEALQNFIDSRAKASLEADEPTK